MAEGEGWLNLKWEGMYASYVTPLSGEHIQN